jgi:hypothetical protein
VTLPATYEEIQHRLTQFQPWASITPANARTYLENRLPTYQMLGLYPVLFPEAYARTTASHYGNPASEGHSPLELEFLETLEQVIPVSDWTIETAQDSRLPGFPIWDMGVDIYEEGAIEHFYPALQRLLALSREGRHLLENIDGREWYEGTYGVELDQIQHPEQVPLDRLRQRFNRQPLPLRFLPLLLSILDKRTGNDWLDSVNNEAWYGYGSQTAVEWTEANLRSLIHQWNQAQSLLKQTQALLDWLEDDLPQRFSQLLTLWNRPSN